MNSVLYVLAAVVEYEDGISSITELHRGSREECEHQPHDHIVIKAATFDLTIR